LDGNGLISGDELKEFYRRTFGDKLFDSEIEEMMADADMTRDGHIQLGEFVDIVVKASKHESSHKWKKGIYMENKEEEFCIFFLNANE
jgi:Ca2+-binding EF-hand superfamily protein